jgi:hypothetical protein
MHFSLPSPPQPQFVQEMDLFCKQISCVAAAALGRITFETEAPGRRKSSSCLAFTKSRTCKGRQMVKHQGNDGIYEVTCLFLLWKGTTGNAFLNFSASTTLFYRPRRLFTLEACCGYSNGELFVGFVPNLIRYFNPVNRKNEK